MSAQIIQLDTKRRKVWERLICLFCHREDYRSVVAGRRYYECKGCEETASVPLWRVGQR